MEESSKSYNVLVIATMSAGKTSVINSLIGQELLHSANEATTATIMRVQRKNENRFFWATPYSYDDVPLSKRKRVNPDILKEWNANSKIKYINLSGPFRFLKNNQSKNIIIYDTPGPNNSMDESHHDLMDKALTLTDYAMVLYILNATQIGTNDDEKLLGLLKSELNPTQKVVFLLNKSDCFDAEKGESIFEIVKDVEVYLNKVGFNNPIIIPTIANCCLSIQKAIYKEKLGRADRGNISSFLDIFNNKNLILASTCSEKIKNKVLKKINLVRNDKKIHINNKTFSKSELKKALYRTGFGLLEKIIKDDLILFSMNPHNQKEKTTTVRQKINEVRNINDNSYIKPEVKTVFYPKSFKIHNHRSNFMSISIYIKHNPFTIETEFLVNGENLGEHSSLKSYANRRLQLWIEDFFPKLSNDILNGEKNLAVIFKGVNADYLDVLAAVENANQSGMNISLDWESSKDSAERLKDIQQLMLEAETNPIFKDKIQENSEIKANFAKAFNKDFDVYVAATMSAGKSTLINAMLGCDLLPAANEATTATIAQIKDNSAMAVGHFRGERLDEQGNLLEEEEQVSSDTLKRWNSNGDGKKTKLIALEGNILGIQERENVRLVITDTPGPNNSQDPEHHRTTLNYIQDSVRNPLIIYILNATQLGVKDDQSTLTEIATLMKKGGKQSKDRFIFVVNKMDAFDPEKGENIDKVLENVRVYLKKNGIDNPLIYPVSANFTRLFRKRETNPDSLTRSERGDLSKYEELFIEEPTMNMVQYMELSPTVKANLVKKDLPEALKRSGLPAVEAMIDEYIDKYSLPERVNRASLSLRKTIEISSNEAELNSNLKKYQAEQDVIVEQLKVLANSQGKTADVRARVNDLIRSGKVLEANKSIENIDILEGEMRNQIRRTALRFIGNVTKESATRELNFLREDINFQTNIIVNKLNSIIEQLQSDAKRKLYTVFDQYVKEIFSEIKDIPLPILKNLTQQVENISSIDGLGLSLEQDEINIERNRVKTGTKSVKTGTERVCVGTRSTSSWWNPFSWGDTENIYEERDRYETVDVYEERVTETVDLYVAWEIREQEIMEHFNDILRAAREIIQEDITLLSKKFLDFMETEFQDKLKELTDTYESKVKNKEVIDRLSSEAQKNLAEIRQFKDKLDQVLAL